MGKKLFEVFSKTGTGVSRSYVAAETIEDATRIADEEIPGKSYKVSEVSKVDFRFVNDVPYGSDDGKTCGEIVEEMKRQAAQEEFFKKHQLKLFEEVK